jgi:hypothetical protein
MTEPRNKSEKISETTKIHLVDCYVSAVHKRREDIFSKVLEKGSSCENDSITLLSRVTKRFFKKNDVRLSNEYVTGECDIYVGEAINNADETIDTKTSWSAHTFFRAINKPLEKNYYWQGQTYMALTGAKKHSVAYCLVNSPAKFIEEEKRRLSYNMDVDSVEFRDACKQIEINHIFDLSLFMIENDGYVFHNDLSEWRYDIPMKERVYLFEFERNDSDIERMYQRIKDCRGWMNENLFKP